MRRPRSARRLFQTVEVGGTLHKLIDTDLNKVNVSLGKLNLFSEEDQTGSVLLFSYYIKSSTKE
jgi:hypothetical protein